MAKNLPSDDMILDWNQCVRQIKYILSKEQITPAQRDLIGMWTDLMHEFTLRDALEQGEWTHIRNELVERGL